MTDYKEYLILTDAPEAYVTGGSEWVDTGATVISQAGQLYRVSDIGVAAARGRGRR